MQAVIAALSVMRFSKMAQCQKIRCPGFISLSASRLSNSCRFDQILENDIMTSTSNPKSDAALREVVGFSGTD